jgi:hypothetical protein
MDDPIPHCCDIDCPKDARWQVTTGPMPDDYTDACDEHLAGALAPLNGHPEYGEYVVRPLHPPGRSHAVELAARLRAYATEMSDGFPLNILDSTIGDLREAARLLSPPPDSTPPPALTGDCSEDCLERCAYPGIDSACEIGAADATAPPSVCPTCGVVRKLPTGFCPNPWHQQT